MYQATISPTARDIERFRKITAQLQDSNHLFNVADCQGILFYVFRAQEDGKTITVAFGFDGPENPKAKAIVGLIKPGVLNIEQVKFFLDDNYRKAAERRNKQ